ncbi:hypothetical protein ACEPAG_6786 [Sanghuangporus baumii]
MFSSTSLISAVLLALSVAAGPVVQIREPSLTLPIVRRFNLTGTTIADADRARAAHLKENGKKLKSDSQRNRRQSSFDVTKTGVIYTADVGVGSPATTYSLLIDTGSSNTWVGASRAYVQTSTSENTGQNVSATYGTGSFSGTEYIDTVTLSSDLVITRQGIGVASTSSEFQDVDGILGLGPVNLTEGTVSGSGTVPTVTDNLFSQGTISEEVVGIYYAPTTVESTTNGELTFGGVDTSRTTSDISYVPITSTSPASAYWGVDQSITYGSSGTEVLSSTAGIVDTGTTLIFLATDAYNTYVSLTGATLDDSVGLLSISSSDYENLQSLFFNIGDQTYELTANAQTWPRSLNTAIGGSSNEIYLVVSDIGSNNGGFDFINGYTFLERFYSVYDTTNGRVGFATTEHTTDTSN